jgi:hypothetical protein
VRGEGYLRYEFVVAGTVSTSVLDQFPEFSVTTLAKGTAFFGPVRDESDVQTIVSRLISLDLPVVDLRPLPD